MTIDELQLLEDFIRDRKVAADYTEVHRYKDFQSTFYGSPEGKRVLNELLYWGHILGPCVPSFSSENPKLKLELQKQPVDEKKVFMMLGERKHCSSSFIHSIKRTERAKAAKSNCKTSKKLLKKGD